MAKFWRKSGGGVFLQLPSSTDFMTDATACCCQDPCSICAAGTTAAEYELTVPSGTLTGTGCSAYEGTFTLSQSGINPCVFIYTFGDGALWNLVLASLYVRVGFIDSGGALASQVVFQQSHTFTTSLDCALSGKVVPFSSNDDLSCDCLSASGEEVTVSAL